MADQQENDPISEQAEEQATEPASATEQVSPTQEDEATMEDKPPEEEVAADTTVTVESEQVDQVDDVPVEQQVETTEEAEDVKELVEQEVTVDENEDIKVPDVVDEVVAPEEAKEVEASVPVSEDVTDAQEAPTVVVETTSREATPPLMADEQQIYDSETPEKPSSMLDFEELLMEDEEDIPQYNREELLQKYQAALHDREQLNQQNHALQHKLAEYFRKKKTEETRQEVDKNVTDQEQRYMKYMSNLEELRQQQAAEQEAYNEQLEEMKERKAEKQGRVEEEWSRAIEFKKAVAMAAINSRSGRPIQPKDIELYELNERKKESEVSQVRLENIKLKNRLRKQEMQLKQKEELAEGLHLIDFEQLKIENQTYNEKIEERNEELLKLRKKITSTVQVLTHLKEKLQFVQAENHVRKDQLAEVEYEVAQKRDILSRTKQARDGLRHENNKFQQKCGLLGNADLLRDFEVGTDEADDLEHRLDLLKRTHAELTLSLNGVKKKIELAKDNQS